MAELTPKNYDNTCQFQAKGAKLKLITHRLSYVFCAVQYDLKSAKKKKKLKLLMDCCLIQLLSNSLHYSFFFLKEAKKRAD